MFVFISITKKSNAKECANYHSIVLISQASKVMAQNLSSQASTVCKPRTSRCSSWIQKRQGNQRSNCQHLLDHGKSKRVPEKNIYFCLIDYAIAFNCVDHNKLWKILKEMGTPDHLTCLLRNLYAGQEAAVRTGHGTTHWFQIEKGVRQVCILSPCLFNFYVEYIMRNAGLDVAQAGIKIPGRNINKLRYTDDTTLMAEREKELKRLLMKVKEKSGKPVLKHNILNRKIMASSIISTVQSLSRV